MSLVHRHMSGDHPLASLLIRSAVGAAGNTLLRLRGGEFRAAGGTSLINGEAAAIERVQRSSADYAQRPDRSGSCSIRH